MCDDCVWRNGWWSSGRYGVGRLVEICEENVPAFPKAAKCAKHQPNGQSENL